MQYNKKFLRDLQVNDNNIHTTDTDLIASEDHRRMLYLLQSDQKTNETSDTTNASILNLDFKNHTSDYT